MAQPGNFDGVNQRCEGVFTTLSVPGTNIEVRSIVTSSFHCDGVNIEGVVYVPMGVRIAWSVDGVNVEVRKVQKTWEELAEIAKTL